MRFGTFSMDPTKLELRLWASPRSSITSFESSGPPPSKLRSISLNWTSARRFQSTPLSALEPAFFVRGTIIDEHDP